MLPIIDIKDAARLTQLSEGVLHSWVYKDVVKPARPGGRGRWAAHGFSAQQLFALAMVAADKTVPGIGANLSLAQIGQRVKDYAENLSDSDIQDWVNGERSPWEEERRVEGDAEFNAEMDAQDAHMEELDPMVKRTIEKWERELAVRMIAVLTYLRSKRAERSRIDALLKVARPLNVGPTKLGSKPSTK